MLEEVSREEKHIFFSSFSSFSPSSSSSSSWCYVVEWVVSTVKSSEKKKEHHTARNIASETKTTYFVFVPCLLFSTDSIRSLSLSLFHLHLFSSHQRKKILFLLRVKTTISSVDSHDRLKRVESQWHSINNRNWKNPFRLLLFEKVCCWDRTWWKEI